MNNPWDIGVDSNTNTIYVTDNAGHTVSVIDGSPIQSPILETRDIINIINNMTLTHGTTNSLDSKLDTAISYLNANDNPNAKSVLQSFLNEVTAQTGKKITTDQANQLVTAAQNVIKSIP